MTMKVCILAGGLGTRLSEETTLKPKPMVDVGGHPMLWHIMKIYEAHGFNEFVVALGYKGEVIKDYFVNYVLRNRSLTVDLASGMVTVHDGDQLTWKVHLLDTGAATMTGGRVKRLAQFIGDEPFMLTYGDGVCSLNLNDLLAFHRAQGKKVTLTAVRPPARFGNLSFQGSLVERFEEKPQIGEGWINGGFFVVEPGIADYIDGDATYWEREPLERLASEGNLAAYKHDGFWQCMDTLRDKTYLDELWRADTAPWKVW